MLKHPQPKAALQMSSLSVAFKSTIVKSRESVLVKGEDEAPNTSMNRSREYQCVQIIYRGEDPQYHHQESASFTLWGGEVSWKQKRGAIINDAEAIIAIQGAPTCTRLTSSSSWMWVSGAA